MMEKIMDDKSTEKLIRLIKSTDLLWNLRNPDYKNLKRKAQAWKWIADQIGVPKDVCKKKWKGLRDCYSREYKKKLNEHDQEEETSHWKYRESMSFIKDQLQRRVVSTNPFEEDDDETVSETFQEMSNLSDKDISYNFIPTAPDLGDSLLSSSSTTRGLKRQKISEDEDKKIDFDFITCAPEHEETFVPSSPISRVDKGKRRQREDQTAQKLNFNFIQFANEDDEVEAPAPSSARATKRHKINIANSIESTMKAVKEHLAKPQPTIQIVSSPSSLNPEDEFFCRSLVEKLSKFPLRHKNTAKIELMHYLCEKEAELSDM